MSAGLLASAWLVGALGGVHCFAMCGGLVGALAARDATHVTPLLPARAIALRHVQYHVGRVLTYALLGAALGGAGSAMVLALGGASLQRAVHAASSVLLLALGANLVVRVPAVAALQHAGAKAFAPLFRVLAPCLRAPGATGRIAMGIVWGLMPCALVYSVLPLALLAGGAAQGAGVMLAFGIGTIPNLLAGGMLASRAPRMFTGRALRLGAAVFMIAFGIAGLARVFGAPGAFGTNVFCLT